MLISNNFYRENPSLLREVHVLNEISEIMVELKCMHYYLLLSLFRIYLVLLQVLLTFIIIIIIYKIQYCAPTNQKEERKKIALPTM